MNTWKIENGYSETTGGMKNGVYLIQRGFSDSFDSDGRLLECFGKFADICKEDFFFTLFVFFFNLKILWGKARRSH